MNKIILILVVFITNYFSLLSLDEIIGWIDYNDYKESKMKVGAITFIRYSNDGKYLYTYGKDSIFRKWDIDSGKILQQFLIPLHSSLSFDLSSDATKYGYTFYSTYAGNGFKMFDMNNKFIAEYFPSTSNYPCPCKDCLVYSNNRNSSYMFHPYLNKIICEPYFEIDCPTDDLVSQHYYVGCFEEFSSDTSIYYKMLQPGSVKGSLAVSFDGLYSAYNTYRVSMEHDQKTNYTKYFTQLTSVIANNSYAVIIKLAAYDYDGLGQIDNSSYMFSPNSKLLAKKNDDNNIFIYSVPYGSFIDEFYFKNEGIEDSEAFGFSKDENNIIIASNFKNKTTIKYWYLKTHELVKNFDFNGNNFGWKFAFNKDSDYLATGSSDGIIRLFKNTGFPQIKADYTNDTNMFFTNDTIYFHDKSLGRINSWFWDYGDGETSNQQNPFHIYKSAGYFYVRLIVKNEKNSDSIIKRFYIEEKINSVVFKTETKLKESEVIISPNPVTDFIEISFGAQQTIPIQIRIYDVFGSDKTPLPPFEKWGKENSSSQDSLLNTHYSTKIDVSSLSPGLYFVRVGEKVVKFVKI